MSFSFLGRIAAIAIGTAGPSAAFPLQQTTLRAEDVADSTIRAEIAHLGPYPEMHLPATPSTLSEVPLRSWSPLHSEFAEEGLRVRIEAQPFLHPEQVTGDRTRGFTLEGRRAIGWTPGGAHDRISRVELVLDGAVAEVPEDAFTDLFDLQACAPGPVAPLRFATVARSTDGWRIYVLAQVGEGDQTRLVTWVFEDGRYRFRVVDTFRTSG